VIDCNPSAARLFSQAYDTFIPNSVQSWYDMHCTQQTFDKSLSQEWHNQVEPPNPHQSDPALIIFDVSSQPLNIAEKFTIDTPEYSLVMRLCGIIYHAQEHFTSRIICKDGRVYYHDGIETKTISLFEGYFYKFSSDELTVFDRDSIRRRACLLVYAPC